MDFDDLVLLLGLDDVGQEEDEENEAQVGVAVLLDLGEENDLLQNDEQIDHCLLLLQNSTHEIGPEFEGFVSNHDLNPGLLHLLDVLHFDAVLDFLLLGVVESEILLISAELLPEVLQHVVLDVHLVTIEVELETVPGKMYFEQVVADQVAGVLHFLVEMTIEDLLDLTDFLVLLLLELLHFLVEVRDFVVELLVDLDQVERLLSLDVDVLEQEFDVVIGVRFVLFNHLEFALLLVFLQHRLRVVVQDFLVILRTPGF